VIPWSGAGNTFRLFRATSEQFVLSVIIQSSSFIQDFVARVKFGGTHATLTAVKQLPALHLNEGDIRFVRAAIAELAYTAWDMAGFATFLGCSSPPFIWNAERRALIRAELDALMFRAYGIRRDDVEYIMETFPIVKRRDEAEFGEYRTKRLILERYDAMVGAEASGRTYETILEPPPADPSLAHPESTRPSWVRAAVPAR